MLYPSINEIRKKADSRYTIAILAAKRARDLIEGKPALTEDAHCDRPVSIAAWEIAEGLITYERDETASDVEFEDPADDAELRDAAPAEKFSDEEPSAEDGAQGEELPEEELPEEPGASE